MNRPANIQVCLIIIMYLLKDLLWVLASVIEKIDCYQHQVLPWYQDGVVVILGYKSGVLAASCCSHGNSCCYESNQMWKQQPKTLYCLLIFPQKLLPHWSHWNSKYVQPQLGLFICLFYSNHGNTFIFAGIAWECWNSVWHCTELLQSRRL